MRTQLRIEFLRVMRMRWIYLLVAGVAAFTYWNYSMMRPSYGWETYGTAQYESDLDLAREVRQGLVGVPGAEKVLEEKDSDIGQLTSVLQAARSGDSEIQARMMLEYETNRLKRLKEGASAGDTSEMERVVVHLKSVVESGNQKVYPSVGDTPALAVLPKVLTGILPYWMALALPLLLFGSAFVSDPFSDRRSFERLAPISSTHLFLAKVVSVLVISLVALLVVSALPFADAAVRNGLGSLAYPTVIANVHAENGIAAVSSGFVLLAYLSQFVLSVLFLGSAAFLVSRFTNSGGGVTGTLVLLIGAPLAFPNLSRAMSAAVLRLFPPLYLKPLYALGYPPTQMATRAGIDLPISATFLILAGAFAAMTAIGAVTVRFKRGW